MRKLAPPLEPQRIYSLTQVARILQFRTETVRRMAVEGEIPMIQFRGAKGYRFLGWQVKAWLDGKQAETWEKTEQKGAWEAAESNVIKHHFG